MMKSTKYIISYATGIGIVLGSIIWNPSPEVPKTLEQIEEIDIRLSERIRLEDLASRDITQLLDSAATLKDTKDSLETNYEVSQEKKDFEEENNSRTKKIFYQTGLGILLAAGSLKGFIKNKKIEGGF